MKRGAPDHWKMRHLAELLKIPDQYAIATANGIMERLWHYTARMHPDGDITGSPDWAIADACAWNCQKRIGSAGVDHEKAAAFVAALVAAKWLDLGDEVADAGTQVADSWQGSGMVVARARQLLVHDWHDHGDNTAKKYCKEKGLEIKTLASRARVALALPIHSLALAIREDEPPPIEPKADTPRGLISPVMPRSKAIPVRQPANGLTSDELQAAWDRHLKPKSGQPMNTVFAMVLDRADFDVERFRRNHRSYCESATRDGWGYALSFWDWIEAGMLSGAPAKREAETKEQRAARWLDEIAAEDETADRSAA